MSPKYDPEVEATIQEFADMGIQVPANFREMTRAQRDKWEREAIDQRVGDSTVEETPTRTPAPVPHDLLTRSLTTIETLRKKLHVTHLHVRAAEPNDTGEGCYVCGEGVQEVVDALRLATR